MKTNRNREVRILRLTIIITLVFRSVKTVKALSNPFWRNSRFFHFWNHEWVHSSKRISKMTDDDTSTTRESVSRQLSFRKDIDYQQTLDSFECIALEAKCKNEEGVGQKDHAIRIEFNRARDLSHIDTREKVWEKIREAKTFQESFGSADLYQRKWLPVGIETDSGDNNSVFSVAQFNALAEGLSFGPDATTPFQPDGLNVTTNENCNNSIYGGFTAIPYPNATLDFSVRRWRILEVLLTSNGQHPCDIIGMEEVDRFYGFFLPLLQIFGYNGVFVPKTYAPGIDKGWYSDGCALFWNTSMFMAMNVCEYRFTLGTQVFLIATLKHLSTDNIVVVAVTHLKAKQQEANEILRCDQLTELLEALESTVQDVQNTVEESIHVSCMLLGDFNSDPPLSQVRKYNTSALAQLFTEHPVSSTSSSHYHYKSVYPVHPPSPSLYTTWKIRRSETFRRVIDYIFYQGRTECSALLDVPPIDEVPSFGFPNLRYPSDHVLIAGRFRFLSTSQNERMN